MSSPYWTEGQAVVIQRAPYRARPAILPPWEQLPENIKECPLRGLGWLEVCPLNATTDSLFYVFNDIANVSRMHLVKDKVDFYVFRFI